MTNENKGRTCPGSAPGEEIATLRGSGDYLLSVRLFRPDVPPSAQLIILHGVVSHSEWLTPIASRLSACGIEVICPDRRGAGLSDDARGDAPDTDSLFEDVAAISQHFSSARLPTHLSGFCWGASYAIHAVNRMPDLFSSLILIAPSLFPARDIAQKVVVTGPSAEASEVPIVPLDRFTSGPAYEEVILHDQLRTTLVSPRFNAIMVQMTAMLAPRWAKLQIPSLVILAESDRLADNEKHERAFHSLRSARKKLVYVPGEHGVQFDAPDETARHILDWLLGQPANHKM